MAAQPCLVDAAATLLFSPTAATSKSNTPYASTVLHRQPCICRPFQLGQGFGARSDSGHGPQPEHDNGAPMMRASIDNVVRTLTLTAVAAEAARLPRISTHRGRKSLFTHQPWLPAASFLQSGFPCLALPNPSPRAKAMTVWSSVMQRVPEMELRRVYGRKRKATWGVNATVN